MKELQAWIDANFEKIRDDYFSFLRFKTISSDPTLLAEHERCAKWLKNYFQAFGCHSEVIQTPHMPIVYAEDMSAGKSAPTLLIYGHYDVQPVDPIELWKSDPFEPVEKNGMVYARGATDDKGQVFFAITALRLMKALHRKLPVNVKFCIEGEEEDGSQGLFKTLPLLKEKLSTDYLFIIDVDLLDAKTPSINLGARGIVAIEAVLRGSNTDLHSGIFGGIAYNPNRAASELIASLWDADGRITVPHFYDDVVELTALEKQFFSLSNGHLALDAGIEALGGEKGYNSLEASWLRPTLEINGLSGGYSGPGFKTVIPAETRIKITCRLVPNQDPEKIGHYVADFLRKKVKKGIHINVDVGHTARAYRARADSIPAVAVAKAFEEIFHKPCKKIFSGGSIPIVAAFMDVLKPDAVGLGYGLASDNVHAPNEHFGLDRFNMGILTMVRSIENLGTVKK